MKTESWITIYFMRQVILGFLSVIKPILIKNSYKCHYNNSMFANKRSYMSLTIFFHVTFKTSEVLWDPKRDVIIMNVKKSSQDRCHYHECGEIKSRNQVLGRPHVTFDFSKQTKLHDATYLSSFFNNYIQHNDQFN